MRAFYVSSVPSRFLESWRFRSDLRFQNPRPKCLTIRNASRKGCFWSFFVPEPELLARFGCECPPYWWVIKAARSKRLPKGRCFVRKKVASPSLGRSVPSVPPKSRSRKTVAPPSHGGSVPSVPPKSRSRKKKSFPRVPAETSFGSA